MTPAAPVGYLAAGLVFATFCTKRMVTLRALAITSNIAFIGYGYLGELWPILILHARSRWVPPTRGSIAIPLTDGDLVIRGL